MKRDIAFVLFPRFSMIALFGALEPLRVANRFAGPVFSWRFVSSDGAPVAASNEIPVTAEAKLTDIGRPDLALFCASYHPERNYTRSVVSHVRRLARLGIDLGGVDTGPFLLGEAGVLDGHRATCHWESLPGFRESYPEVDATQTLYEIDRGRLTCSGGAATIDMMLDYIGRIHGGELAVRVADQLVHSRLPSAPAAGRLPAHVRYQVGDQRLILILEAMERHTEEPISLDRLAAMGGVSLRQMERLFQVRLGAPPNRIYRRLRLEHGEHLLSYSRLSVTDVAMACGFQGLSQFSRAFSRHFGFPPSSHRTEGDH
ncbi:AraC family carnitine catabolism transcriptional activator [Rhodoligotrophos appendicifer]|uniref:GlxA family transcriptional regulator n=1 Tax=Rhodoligotrophos appendicifer TaxID=987056 RepID=UPI0011859AD3|nr:GlxA family transcriptional regulator [Rhodoligotrophos appendicifer]